LLKKRPGKAGVREMGKEEKKPERDHQGGGTGTYQKEHDYDALN